MTYWVGKYQVDDYRRQLDNYNYLREKPVGASTLKGGIGVLAEKLRLTLRDAGLPAQHEYSWLSLLNGSPTGWVEMTGMEALTGRNVLLVETQDEAIHVGLIPEPQTYYIHSYKVMTSDHCYRELVGECELVHGIDCRVQEIQRRLQCTACHYRC